MRVMHDPRARRPHRWLAAILILAGSIVQCRGADLRLDAIKLPGGFVISVFAANVPGARSLARGDKGTIFVGTRAQGKVYALVDADGDHRAETVHVLASDLNMPNGVAFRDGALYVAEIDRVHRFDGIEGRLANPPPPATLPKTFPDKKHHGWKFIAFGPDGLLYVPVGAPCNICASEDETFASITRMKPDGTGWEVFAHGVRNSVGFDWHPKTGQLWFTDNGRDHLGDDAPPDELNRAQRKGMHFGYPWCHGADIVDPDLGAGRKCDAFTPPARALGPHVAALGMRFYRGTAFPETWRGRIFIAEHGSWNRTRPIGYRIMTVTLSGDEAVDYSVFAEGWLDTAAGRPWGRPVDLLELPDGSLLVSDDFGDAVYRIAWSPKPQP